MLLLFLPLLCFFLHNALRISSSLQLLHKRLLLLHWNLLPFEDVLLLMLEEILLQLQG